MFAILLALVMLWSIGAALVGRRAVVRPVESARLDTEDRMRFALEASHVGVWEVDMRSDTVTKPTPAMRVTNRLVDFVLTASESDAVIGTQFFRVTGLLDPPTRLLRPSFLYRVAAVNIRRRQRRSQPGQAGVAARAGSRTS